MTKMFQQLILRGSNAFLLFFPVVQKCLFNSNLIEQDDRWAVANDIKSVSLFILGILTSTIGLPYLFTLAIPNAAMQLKYTIQSFCTIVTPWALLIYQEKTTNHQFDNSHQFIDLNDLFLGFVLSDLMLFQSALQLLLRNLSFHQKTNCDMDMSSLLDSEIGEMLAEDTDEDLITMFNHDIQAMFAIQVATLVSNFCLILKTFYTIL